MIGLNESNDNLTLKVQKLSEDLSLQNLSNSQQLQVLNQEKDILVQKLVDLQQAQAPKSSESKFVQVSLEDKGKKVKFEDDTKLLGYEN